MMRAPGSRHFNNAQRSHGVICISAVARHPDHAISKRQRLRDHCVHGWLETEIGRQPSKHWTMHPLGSTPSHFVPVVSSHLKLGTFRNLDLRHRQKVFEARFAGNFLKEEPLHLLTASLRSEPSKQRVALAWSGDLQALIPIDEP